MDEVRNKGSPSEQRAVSHKFADGGMAELVYDADKRVTAFAVFRDGVVSQHNAISLPKGATLKPVAPQNNLIKHSALLLAQNAEEFASVEALTSRIDEYLLRYVDLSDAFRRIATYYVLLTWVYEAFNELPYLRLRGDFGSGKTRALTVIGSLCFRPFFASGASTVSPIFHTLDTFQGTLVLDEADFRFTDEKSELVKIFNNGNVRGFPVLRTAMTTKREFDPQAFTVFGPKIVAMRDSFEDQALESRFLTEEMGQKRLRDDIPINLPASQAEESLLLRNQLLMYRFRTLPHIQINDALVDRNLSPRLNQILVPLLSIIDAEELRNEIRETVKTLEAVLYGERSSTLEANILEILVRGFSEPDRQTVRIGDIATSLISQGGSDFERPITNRLVGSIVRRRLRLVTHKSHGVYVVPATERSKIDELATRFGLEKRETVS